MEAARIQVLAAMGGGMIQVAQFSSLMTGSVKNAFGGLLKEVRHYAHKHMHEVLVDLLYMQRELHPAVFTVTDGTVAGDGAAAIHAMPTLRTAPAIAITGFRPIRSASELKSQPPNVPPIRKTPSIRSPHARTRVPISAGDKVGCASRSNSGSRSLRWCTVSPNAPHSK